MQAHNLAVLDSLGLSNQATHFELGNQLESPAGDADIIAMPSVGEVVIEDGFDRFRGFGSESRADVDPSVGIGSDDVEPRLSKGRITLSEYRLSACSATAVAASQ
jgi:hypothetical protein